MELTPDEVLDLCGLVHDKGHVIQRGARLPALDKALRIHRKRSRLRLYRGLYPEEMAQLQHGHWVTDAYVSFSEKPVVGRAFSKQTRTVLALDDAIGFPYWRWCVAELARETDPDERHAQDLDFLEQTPAQRGRVDRGQGHAPGDHQRACPPAGH